MAWNLRKADSSLRRKRGRRPLSGPERVEPRYVMDGSAPQLVADTFEVHTNDDPVSLDVLANDVLGDYSGPAQITAVSFPTGGGTAEISADGKAVVFRPSADFSGDDTFSYVLDGEFTAHVTVHVVSPLVNDSATAYPDGQPLEIDPLGNDPFWSGYAGPRQITALSATQLGGSLSIAADGHTVNYTAPTDPNTLGQTDHFSYIVDGKYTADVGVFLFNPLAPATRDVPQGSGTVELAPLANSNFSQWPDYSGAGLLTKVIQPNSGSSVSIGADGKTVLYQPADGFVGTDNIAYVVDGRYSSTISVHVGAVIADDYYAVDQNDPGMLLSVLDNDLYRNSFGAGMRVVHEVTAVSQPNHGGAVQILPDGSGIRYTPAAGFVGTETFTYLADGRYRANVTVQVTRPVHNDRFPVSGQTIVADSQDNVLDVMANDFHRAGNHTISQVSMPDQGGSVRISSDGGHLLYSPKDGFTGVEQFNYTVDGQYSATVYVTVKSPASDFYEKLDPSPGTTYRIDLASHLPGLEAYTGDGLITAVSVTSGAIGATISTEGKALLVTSSDFSSASVSYTLDGKYTATIYVSFPASRFLGPSYTVVEENQSSTLNVLVNALWQYGSTPNGIVVYQGQRLITDAVGAQHGTVSVAPDGKTVIYRPDDDFVGRDSFKYLVDGQELGTATVQVIRRVRDDHYRVDVSSQNNVLPVLLNDQLGGGYTGIGRITQVAAPAHGSAHVSADGQTLVYTPPAGFSGVDTVQYTVDGHLRATVEIKVESEADSQFPRFDTLAALEDWLLQNAVEQYGYLFGTSARYAVFPGGYVDSTWYSGLTTNSTNNHSDTNVQVAGVDEADLTENDGRFLYVLSGGKLVISSGQADDLLTNLSETTIEGTPVGMYLAGNRLTVVSRPKSYSFLPWQPSLVFPQPSYNRQTIVTVLDVTDRSAPTLVQRTELDGLYVDSRMVGDTVYVALDNSSLSLPGPQIVQDSTGAAPGQLDVSNSRYETKEEYVQRIRDHFGELLDSVLPHFNSYGPGGELVRSGLTFIPEQIGRPLDPADKALVGIVSIDATGSEPGIVASTGLVTTTGGLLYMNQSNMYLLRPNYGGENQATDILKFSLDRTTGQVSPVARGQVPGRVLDQFSVDETGGALRVATTVSNAGADNWSGVAENDLWVLEQDADTLELVGSLQNLAHGESIRSVRYFGQRAVITTFPTGQSGIDPVYSIDLSDPTEPRFVGALTLPGFNQYMQFIDDTHVLAVGTSAPTSAGASGAGLPMQVSLFDVSDFTHPRLVDQYTLAHFSTSVAQQDHHAFGWFADLGLLALPVGRTYTKREDLDGDGYYETSTVVNEDQVHYFRIHTGEVTGGERAIDPVGTIALGVAALRSAFIGETLFAIGDGQIVASSLNDPGAPLASVTWDVSHDVVGPGGVMFRAPWDGPFAPAYPTAPSIGPDGRVEIHLADETSLPPANDQDPMDASIQQARADLGRRLGVSPESALLVLVEAPTSDSNGSSSASGAKLVFRWGEQYLLYQVASDGSVELVDANFRFPSAGGTASTQPPQTDVDGDGRMAAHDALLVVNYLLEHGGSTRVGPTVLRELTPSTTGAERDVNHDGLVSPHDLLLVLNALSDERVATAFAAPADEIPLPDAAVQMASAIVFSQNTGLSESPQSLDVSDSSATSASIPRSSAVPVARRTDMAKSTSTWQDERDLAVALTDDWSTLEDDVPVGWNMNN